jgi:cell division protein FtsL
MKRAAPKAKSKARPEWSRRRRMGSGVACLVLLGLTLAALGHVAVQARHLDVALALGKEQRIQSELLEAKRRLKSEIGHLKDPARISTMARDQLKMAPVVPTDIRPVGRRP